MQLRSTRLKLECHSKALLRFGELPQLQQHIAQVGENQDLPRQELMGPQVGSSRLLQVSTRLEHIAEVVAGLGVRRIQLQGLVKTRGGLIPSAASLEDHAQVVVGVCVIGCQGHRPLQQTFRLIQPTLIHQDGPQVVERRELLGIFAQDLLIKTPGHVELTLLMGRDGLREKLLQG